MKTEIEKKIKSFLNPMIECSSISLFHFGTLVLNFLLKLMVTSAFFIQFNCWKWSSLAANVLKLSNSRGALSHTLSRFISKLNLRKLNNSWILLVTIRSSLVTSAIVNSPGKTIWDSIKKQFMKNWHFLVTTVTSSQNQGSN